MKRLAISLLLLAAWPWSALAAAPKPNIVFILADDLGYGDLGCYGQTKIRTPNLDRLAAEGMRFTNFYAGCSVCAPSRCTLLTGKHLGHATVRDNLQRGPGLEGQHPMEPGTVTVAQLLKKAGYATAIVGKWGLGMPERSQQPAGFRLRSPLWISLPGDGPHVLPTVPLARQSPGAARREPALFLWQTRHDRAARGRPMRTIS